MSGPRENIAPALAVTHCENMFLGCSFLKGIRGLGHTTLNRGEDCT